MAAEVIDRTIPLDLQSMAGLGRARVEERGLFLPDDLSYREWEAIGGTLQFYARSVMWLLGDWLRYGERKWGEMYAQAIDDTGYAYGTLRNAQYVAERVELSRRRDNLSWSHHQEVASLEPEEQDAYLDAAEEQGWAKNDLRQAVRHKTLSPPPPSPIVGTYRTLVADPPWDYDNRATRAAATNHYDTLTVPELCALSVDGVPVHERAADLSHLYLWTTNSFLREAFDVLDAWGFEYKTTLVWVKPQLGIGNYFRSSHEFVLFGVRGGLRVLDSNQRSWFECPRAEHSRKPSLFYDLVERVSPGPYLELFARTRSRPLGSEADWTLWGHGE